jgi:UDP-N-acetylmuramyl pentapeptide phosphotransferase/UDP-N-acetylglucosamine-1-phosphate transferase
MELFTANHLVFILILAVFLLLLEYLYLRLAKKHKIFSTENERSSHSGEALIGGGLIFFFSFLLYSIFFNFPYPNLLLGAFLLAFISFVDDLGYVKHSYRLLVHLLALTLMIPELGIGQYGYFFVLCIIILGVGVLNSFNFIDGINGMLALLSISVLGPLLYLSYSFPFIDPNLIIAIIISLVIFMFFNFRKNAICFAGDVGSIVIGYLIFIFIIALCITRQSYFYLLLISVPGADAGMTLLFRIMNNENILLAHRTFLFHILILKGKLGHLTTSVIYSAAQLLISTGVLFLHYGDPGIKLAYFILVIIALITTYILFRKKYFDLSVQFLRK